MSRFGYGYRHLFVLTLGAAFLTMTGCHTGKMNMPKISMPKMKAPNLAFWKKENRIASQPNDELTPASQNLNPETDMGSTRMAKNSLPAQRQPQRQPYKLPEIDDNAIMENPASVRGVSPEVGNYNDFRNDQLGGGSSFVNNQSSGGGSRVTNPYAKSGTTNTNQSTDTSAKIQNQFSGSNTPQFDNGFQPQGSTQSSGNSRLLKNEFVKSNSDTASNQKYPDTGHQEFRLDPQSSKTDGSAMANSQNPQFQLSNPKSNAYPDTSTMQNPHFDKKMDSLAEMQNTQKAGGNQIDGQSNQVRTADLPAALQGGTGGYAPGSTGNGKSGSDLPADLELPKGSLKNSTDNQNQMLPPTSSPAGGGQFELK